MSRLGARLEFDHWTFTHRDAEHATLLDLCATVEPGECVTVMGAGGSGKSSLCLSAAGVIPHLIHGTCRGRVLVQKEETIRITATRMARLLGLVLQDFESQLFSSSVVRELAFGLENQNLDRAAMAYRIDRILGRPTFANFAHCNPAHLSGGLRQLLAIASVLAMQAGLICLDEPTTDLDPKNRRMIHDMLSEAQAEDAAILIADHRPETAFFADKVWLLKNGTLVRSGTPQDIMTDAKLLTSCSVQPPGVVQFLHDLECPALSWMAIDAEDIVRRRFVVPEGHVTPHLQGRSPGDVLLEAKGLTYYYGGTRTPALNDVNVKIHEGEFIVIIGANGSGKSTLLKHFIRLLKPSDGEVRIDGVPIHHWSQVRIAEAVGYVFQNPDQQIFAATVEEEVQFALRNFGSSSAVCQERTKEALSAVGLGGTEKRDPFKMSRGERQRLAVATALAMRPRALLLDEPTKGIDYDHRSSLLELIGRLYLAGHTVVMVTHSIALAAEYATRVVVMNGGRICLDGSPKQVLSDNDALTDSNIVLPEAVKLSNRLGLKSFLPGEMAREVRAWPSQCKVDN